MDVEYLNILPAQRMKETITPGTEDTLLFFVFALSIGYGIMFLLNLTKKTYTILRILDFSFLIIVVVYLLNRRFDMGYMSFYFNTPDPEKNINNKSIADAIVIILLLIRIFYAGYTWRETIVPDFEFEKVYNKIKDPNTPKLEADKLLKNLKLRSELSTDIIDFINENITKN